MEWMNRSLRRMEPVTSKATYVNYLRLVELAVNASYGDDYSRLVDLTEKFDLENVYHLNRRPYRDG